MILEKKCSRCKKTKLTSCFDKATKSKDGLQYLCKECHKEDYITNKDKRSSLSKESYKLNSEKKIKSQKEWALKNSDKVITYKRKWKLLNIYGITEEEFNTQNIKQEGRCAICGSTSTKHTKSKNLFIDHCHKTGKFRGLLCNNCNNGLGKFEDNIEYLEKAIEYLKIHNG